MKKNYRNHYFELKFHLIFPHSNSQCIYLGELINIYKTHIDNNIEYNITDKEPEIGLLNISKLKKEINVENIKNVLYNYIF